MYFKPSEIRLQINLNCVEEEVNNFFELQVHITLT
jgi:hypothetical protein